MKNLLLLLPILLFSCNQPKIYKTENIEKAKLHSTVAVLPFTANVQLRPDQMESLSEKEMKKLEIHEGKSVQQAFYTWFLNQKNKEQIVVRIQDENKTNRILSENNISPENIDEYSSDELGKLLHVDGIFRGHISTNKPMSEEAAAILGELFDYWGYTNSGDFEINLYDVQSNELLWRYDQQISRSVGSDNKSIINTVMKKASKKLPYLVKQD